MFLLKQFGKYVTPSIISMWVFSIYSILDGLFVSNGVGEHGLVAVNLSLPVTCFISAVALLLATGSSVAISVALGQNDIKRACNIFNQNLVVASVVSVCISIFIITNIDAVARFLGATESTIDYVKNYLGVLSGFAIFSIVSYNLEVLVKVDGTPAVSTLGVISCALLDILLNYILIFKLSFGVVGAAIANGVAHVCSTSVFLLYFLFKSKTLRFGPFRLDLGIYRRLLPTGLADSITEFSSGLIVFIYNRAILLFIGEAALVSYTVIAYTNTLVLMTMTGISQGMQPLVSYYHGCASQKSCHTILKYAYFLTAAFSLLFFAAAGLLAGPITNVFIQQESTAYQYTVNAFRLFSCSFLVVGFNVVSSAFFAALEQPRASITISLARGFILLILCLLMLPCLLGENGVWLASGTAELLCLAVTGMFFWGYARKKRFIA